MIENILIGIMITVFLLFAIGVIGSCISSASSNERCTNCKHCKGIEPYGVEHSVFGVSPLYMYACDKLNAVLCREEVFCKYFEEREQ